MAAWLQRKHPQNEVDPTVLYVDNGKLLTSAGGMAALDLCLYIIRQDHGASVAADAARHAVMPLERHGGQSQFVPRAPPSDGGDSLSTTLKWMRNHLTRELSVSVIARHAKMSERTLARRFREQTGTTSAKWVTQARVHAPQVLLETTVLPVERVAFAVGFESPVSFRTRFRQGVGVSPSSYRRSFRASEPGS